MGCTASHTKKGTIFNVKIRSDPPVTSSELLLPSEEIINSNELDASQTEKEKCETHRLSLSNSSDTDPDVKTKQVRKPGVEKLPTVRLPPKENIHQNFSFKQSQDSSIEKEKEVILNHSFNPFQTNYLSNGSQKEEKSLTATFLKPNSVVMDSRSSGRPPVLIDISNASFRNSNATDGKSKENEEINSCPKNVMDWAGSTFSFMNLRFDNSSQPNVFYAEENKVTSLHPEKYFINPFMKSLAAPKGSDGNHDNNEERLMSLSEVSSVSCQSTARGNSESKGHLKTDESKDIPSPNDDKKNVNNVNVKSISFQPESIKINATTQFGLGSAISTNIGSLGTLASLTNLGKEESKKVSLPPKFRQNLVELVKEQTKSKPELQSFKSLTAKVWNTCGNLYAEDGKKDPLSMKLKVSSEKDLNRLTVKPKVSSLKIDMRTNLINLTKEEDENESENNFDFLHKESLDSEGSLEFHDLELPEDEEDPSPAAQSSLHNRTRSNTPKALLVSNGNSSFSRQIDSSTFLDKTIYNLEDNITRLDLDKYSIYEYVANVEFDERNNVSGRSDNTPINQKLLTNRILDTKELNTSLNQSRSQNQTPSGTPQKGFQEKCRSRPKSFHTSEKPRFNETNTPKSYLSPETFHHRALSITPQEKAKTPELKRTSSVIETSRLDKSVDEEGQKKINQYLLIKDLGRGSFGKVKLALHCETKQQFAIKISNKKRLKRKLMTKSSSAFTLLATEVAIMKKMDHPNIVKLFEVIDDPNNDKIYIAMEYVKKGPVLSKNFWRSELSKVKESNIDEIDPENVKKNKLSEAKAKKYFRHLILALDYLHNTVGIVHRDIKPENLLVAEDDTLKLSDFGISKIMENGDDLLDTNAGTKLYLAPETWKGKSFRGKPADIWAAGGTLYYFLTGKSPFQGLLVDDVKRRILEEEVKFAEDLCINPMAIDLIKACLTKDPEERITLEEIMVNDWLTDNGKNPLVNYVDANITPNEDDISKALTKINFMAVVMITAKAKRKANIARMNVERKKSQVESGQSPIAKERL